MSDTTGRFKRNAFYFINIYPEVNRTEYFKTIEDDGSQYTCPLGFEELATDLGPVGLMTLQTFFEGGNDISEPKLLACVKSIGRRKKSK